jgi:hypothetical protein
MIHPKLSPCFTLSVSLILGIARPATELMCDHSGAGCALARGVYDMADGHTATTYEKLDERSWLHFSLALTYLITSGGRIQFVIHATYWPSYADHYTHLKPQDFLSEIGLQLYNGKCPFHCDPCFYKVLETPYKVEDLTTPECLAETQQIRDAFRMFSDRIEELYNLRRKQNEIFQRFRLQAGGSRIFEESVELQSMTTDFPAWIRDVQSVSLIDLEKEKDTLDREIRELSDYLPLIYGDGDVLEQAVVKSFQLLGLSTWRLENTSTVDICAEEPDGSRKFGIEATGIIGGVTGDSEKVGRILEFEIKKEHGEKSILLANTYKAIPIKDRKGRENFSWLVRDVLTRNNVLLMTGWDLYRMLGDVLEEKKEKGEIIDILYTTNGVLQYNWTLQVAPSSPRTRNDSANQDG